MKAIQLLAFFNGRGSAIHGYGLYVVDSETKQGQTASAYPIKSVKVDQETEEILLTLRFPDEPQQGTAFHSIGEFLDAFLPAASDHPEFVVEASVAMQMKQFSRFDLPLLGISGNDEGQVAMFMADGLSYLERVVGI